MFDAIASPAGLNTLLVLFGLGFIGALAAAKSDRLANFWSNGLAMLGSIWGMLFASSIFVSGHEVAAKVATSSFSQFSISFHVDKLSAFFIFVISLVALLCSTYGIGYVKEYYKRYNIGALGFFYNTFILGMLLVVTASNGLWFLAAWEIMSLASYFLVIYDRDNPQNIRAGFMYLVMTHVGAAFILLSLLVLYHYSHSFDFAALAAAAPAMPPVALGAVFVMMFIGLGTKAGIVPLHIWLPSAHPAAPSHVSALMSGVMIKTGIYMMIRLFLDILHPAPLWWGVVVLIAGAVSSLLGVLYALTEHDIKRLLAYHSIENIGIILLGLGSALIFSSLHRPELMVLALVASLFHTLNHAVFKSLLFMSAGSMIQATHTRNIEQYGGLLKVLPFTGLFFLVGSMAISALPPFNGFFSEWLTFQSLFNGLAMSGTYVQWVFVAATASLAFTGGLALACFVKAFGVSFLARPRSQAAKKAKESSAPMLVGMAGLALACLAIGVLSSPVAHALQDVASNVTGVAGTVVNTTHMQTLSVRAITASVSGPAVVSLLLLVPAGVFLGVRYGVYRRQKVVTGKTWDCGTELNERMEITASGFSQSIVRIFGMFLRPALHHQIEHHDSAKPNPYSLKSQTVSMHVHDLYQAHLYRPLYAGLLALSRGVRRLQNGNLNAYVLYIFVIVIIALVLGA